MNKNTTNNFIDNFINKYRDLYITQMIYIS